MKNEYAVEITEVFKKTVYIEAANITEALERAEENWNNGDYIIDSENFDHADFNEGNDE